MQKLKQSCLPVNPASTGSTIYFLRKWLPVQYCSYRERNFVLLCLDFQTHDFGYDALNSVELCKLHFYILLLSEKPINYIKQKFIPISRGNCLSLFAFTIFHSSSGTVTLRFVTKIEISVNHCCIVILKLLHIHRIILI